MESKRRVKRKTLPASSDDESIMEPIDEPMEKADSPEKVNDLTQGLSSMTEEEMAQHLKLCMKLSVENKINMKNAFGLHLIEIMQKIVKKSEHTDIQQASLSLQASSKIYAGRVEALYQDTFRFHGHLQSIVSGNKKDKKTAKSIEDQIEGGAGDDDYNDDGDDSEKGRTKSQKNKCKSFLKPEETLRMESEVSALSTGEPHGNFNIINAAFSTSRLAPKLLSCLHLVNDSCMLRCAIPEPCFKPKIPLNSVPFMISPKLEGILDKLKNFNASQSEFQALLASTEKSFNPVMSTPKPDTAPSMLFNDDEAFDAPCNDDSMMAPPADADGADLIESTIEKFDVLNITVDTFVNDIAAAVTNNGIDHNKLPPNSALKKILDKSKRSSVKPTVGKTTKRKPKEPFFAGRSADDIRHLFVKGRNALISQKVLSEWSVENTTNIDFGYEFLEETENGEALESDFKQKKGIDQILDIIKQNDLQYYFKHYFNKESQMWRVSRRQMRFDLSFPGGTPLGNQTENKRIASMAPNDPEVLALSFQNMSLHDSIHENLPDCDDNVSDHGIAYAESDEPQFLVPPEPFETDIEEMMVKPPELVRPTSVKYDTRPVNLNTENIKDLLWKIISKRLELKENPRESSEVSVLFSEVYEELKIRLEKEISEFISMQFAFVVLLILANQKTLLIENMEENTDLRIKQDVSEIDVSENV